ncbi:7904_t:CDS:10 [Dentiscutata erythropus]|uniref:7904_t:CDS:1 n=1 Tax=Dentiscutata erythropus TaxID=1348616 RepID=A0A9N9GBK6_9GLOM|nr:7904_t:CDS:10 [Dentiscutata erythropus]
MNVYIKLVVDYSKLEAYLKGEGIKIFNYSQFSDKKIIGQGGSAIVLHSAAIIVEISQNKREKIIDNTPSDYAYLIEKSWSSDPDQRPTLDQILIKLENLSKETAIHWIYLIKGLTENTLNTCECYEDNKIESNNDTNSKNDSSKLDEVFRDNAPEISNVNMQSFTGYIYLEATDDMENANRQVILARSYTGICTEETQYVLYANLDFAASNEINQDFEIDVADKFINETQRIFEKLSGLLRPLKELKDKSLKIKNASTELIGHLKCLELYAHAEAYSKRIEFITFSLDSSNIIEILFKNVVNTEEEINRRAKILSSCFHPDNTKYSKSPLALYKIHKSQGDGLFKLISGFKENLLNKTMEQPKTLKKDDIKEPSSELLNRSMHMGELAYHQFRAACKIADKAKLPKRQSGFNNAMALIRTNDQGISFNDREIIQNTLVNTAAKLFVKAESSLVCYQTPYKEILRAKEHATAYKFKGGAASVVGAGVGSLTLLAAGANIYEAVYVTGIATMGVPFGIVAGVTCVGFGCYYGFDLFKKGQEMFTIRENLNKIMNKALSAYDDKNFQKFINALSEEYDSKNHKRLLNCRDKIGITGIDSIVDTLKMYSFRSDGIVYLLVMLGEVLGSGKIKIEGVIHTALKADAKKIFQLALNEGGAYGKFKDTLLSKEHTRLALNYLQGYMEMPFISRLEEMRNIARINIAILNIIEHAYEEVIETIEEVRKFDFLWIISSEVLSDTDTSSVETNSASELDDKYISYLNNQQSFNQNKYYKAIYFEHLAEKEAKINKLNSLFHWQFAQENYKIAREINPDNPIYSLGYARCLLKLSKYTQVIKLSDTCPALNSLSEYWYLRSVAYLKQTKELVKKLNINNVVEHHINRYKKELIYETDYLKNSHSNESPVYNILSIDGGGIRGTGGIIAAGLSAPKFEPIYINDKLIEYKYSNSTPIFSASELLNIYKNESEKLFTKPASWLPNWFNLNDKYTNEGRNAMFKRFFDETKLSNSLTELVIPAANESYSIIPHLFTCYDARKNSKNEEVNGTYVDILMATTAAPTFFPPHKIGSKTFIDGGIHLNNPTSTAYTEAIRYSVPQEKISVLPLGTGCYLPDPQNPGKYRNLLFWAQNLPKFMISAQEGNTDREMCNMLKNRYQRWQVFFEEPVGLDDHESISSLLELGYQYIEELDCSDENPINKLVESLIPRV